MSKEHVELYRKHRPSSLKRIVGQADAVSVLSSKIKAKKLPHAILFTGPSGVGKTTMARIVIKHLGGLEDDFEEVNCAGVGIDKIRSIGTRTGFRGLQGGPRGWILDEAHKLTSDGQNALLKMLEEAPEWIYFILCTTDPQKIIKTIHTRCMQIKLKSMGAKEVQELVENIASIEGMELREEVIDRIVDAAEGSARQALVLLDTIREIEGEEAQLAAITNPEAKQVAFDLVKALLWEKANWKSVSKILQGIDNEDPEGLRYLVLACATKEMLKGTKNSPRAYMIVTAFRDNFYDSKFSGLVAACWEVVQPA